MGLANTIQKAAKTAFSAIGDIPLICTYTSKGTPVYDPDTGGYTSTDTDYEDLEFLFEDYEAKDIDGTVIRVSDQKASIPSLNLTPTPKIKDEITDSDSNVWTVEGKGQDPARALWIFQVRESG